METPERSDDPTLDPSQETQPGTPNRPSSTAESGETLADAGAAASPSAGASPRTIGPYRLVRKLGEGGMGQVWLAEQIAPLQRLVAIKLIRAGVSDNVLLERFESERQALARMNHPAIAKVFDAGATPDGTPYFVMEYVPGIPITLYCDQKRLSIRERLELFVKVCEGVQHAHQKAILHRDLKPANILVTEIDGQPAPRIIDFGIAKAIGDRDPLATMFTRAGHFIGTPVYMSPEQADPGVRDVDTRSDVYSLAVILYELLTGSLPFDPTELRREVQQEQLRRLYEQDPPLPSIQFRKKTTTQVDTAAQTAKLRSTEPQELVSQLRGDLDWITMKALERDRARRYGTPSEFAGDLLRFLDNEPVSARPASASYRFQKYVRRHRLGVSVAAAAVLLLVAFSATQSMQIRRIREERDRTARERDRANRIADFMTRMFKVSDPSEARGNSITAREVLDKASKEIDTGLAKDPETQAQMMDTMGDVYENLGLYAQAEQLSRRALEVRTQALGPSHRDTIVSMRHLSNVLQDQSKYPEAERLARSALDLSRKQFGPSDTETLRAVSRLGNLLREEGRYPEAESILRQGLLDLQNNKDADKKLLISFEQNLAICLAYQGKFADAEKGFREVYDLDRKALGDDNPEVLSDLSNVGNALLQEQKYTEAETTYRQVLESKRRILGPEHPSTLLTMGNLALSLALQKRYAQAEPLYRQVLEIKARTLGPDNYSTLVTKQQLADNLQEMNRLAEAEQLIREALASERRVLGPEHSDTLITQYTLGEILVSRHLYSEAEAVFRQTLALQIKVLTAHHPQTARTECSLAQVLALQGKREEAFTHLQSCVDDGPRPSDLLEALSDNSLNSLHSDPRFPPLLDHAKQLAAGSPQN
jgi:non-specific serine/threonine protein kinase/serine/threonine-protein kinase